ncbi:MAG: hypothetical protein J2P59_07390 [Acidimicrobiales bacterium]|nr:hypothetical protein [Acidimicrobiales bacterium]
MQFSGLREHKAIRRQTAGLLAGLGGTSTDVATSLAGYQVRGRPRDANGCAVAVYLQAVLGGDPRIKAVRVSETSVRITLLRRGRRVQVPSPQPVRAFIESFDHGLFPSLVRPAVADGEHVDVPASREAETAVPLSS